MEKATAKRMQKRYRVLWDQNSGQAGYYNPPLSPERVAQGHFGFFAGRPGRCVCWRLRVQCRLYGGVAKKGEKG